jgi:hypothetical protein
MTAEATYISLLCALIGGAEPETARFFEVHGYQRPRYIRVDCETPTHVIEIGLDERASSRDSVHQAALAAAFTGKQPMVVLIDTDGTEGRYQLEMRLVTHHLGVAYTACSARFLERWSATSGLRQGGDGVGNDLPADPTVAAHCPIGPLLEGVATRSALGAVPG